MEIDDEALCDMSASVIAAIYNNKDLIGILREPTKEGAINPYGYVEFNMTIQMSDYPNATHIKIFIWEDIKGFKPIMKDPISLRK